MTHICATFSPLHPVAFRDFAALVLFLYLTLKAIVGISFCCCDLHANLNSRDKSDRSFLFVNSAIIEHTNQVIFLEDDDVAAAVNGSRLSEF